MTEINSRSAETIVLTITERSVRGLGASASIIQLVKSLVWPFVARQSLRKEWFSLKEFNRFIRSMRVTAKRLIEVESKDNKEQTFLKYWLDSYLCQVFHDHERPPKEDWIVSPLFSGWLKRYVARMIARRDISFIYSLQKGSKRSWPALGDLKKSQALEKHSKRLSENRGFVPKDLVQEIVKTSKNIFRNVSKPRVHPTKFMPSGSACLQASRRSGGALSLFSRYLLPLENPDSKLIGKLPVLNATLNKWRQDQFDLASERALEDLATGDFQPGSSPRALDVEVVAIPEPGKFRIITKGHGYLYSALQPLQGLCLSAWKKCFASTMLIDDLQDRVQLMDAAIPNKDFFWCSVDYDAATDLLKRDATYAAFEGLEGAPFCQLGFMSLAPGFASYPPMEVDGECIPAKKIFAREGQLMGHPLSFPFLCLINLAVYRCALRRWVQEKPRRGELAKKMWKNVLVNGDDMLFKCDATFYPIFRKTANDAGFQLSQGKNYFSPDCCMINSQIFKRVNGKMKRYGYLNQKLLINTSLKSGDSSATPTQIGKDAGRMVSLCPWTQCAIPAIMRRWRKDWFGPFYRPNWYLPVHLGGFGIPRKFGPAHIRITRSQREMAARFVHDPRMALYRRKGVNLPTAKLAGALANWRMVPGDYVAREGESTDVDDAWLERIAYAARANSDHEIEVSDAVFVTKFRPQYRLKPMSIDTLNLYWEAQLFATKLPPCPPIGYIYDHVSSRY